jgi:hypothetical protein
MLSFVQHMKSSIFSCSAAGLAKDAEALAELLQMGGKGEQRQQQQPLEGLLDTLRDRHWQEFSDGEGMRQQQYELRQQLERACEAAASRCVILFITG